MLRLDLRAKIAALALTAAALPIVVLGSVVLSGKRSAAREAGAELEFMARLDLGQNLRDLLATCRTVDALMAPRLAEGAADARRMLDRAGGISFDADVLQPVVDELRRSRGLALTIHQRVSPRGDMLAVASSARGGDGRRLAGTLLPAALPDGEREPAIQAVLAGRVHRGMERIGTSLVATAYEPLRDGKGEVVGMLVVAAGASELDALYRSIVETRIGGHGYFTILGARGRQRGVHVISKDGSRDGESIWGLTDASGRPLIRDLVRDALARPTGEIRFTRYPWKNPDDVRPWVRVVADVYFPPWDWYVNAGAPEEEFTAARRGVETAFDRLLLVVGAGGGALLLAASALALLIALRLSRPLAELASSATRIADGDLRGLAAPEQRAGERDEAHILSHAFHRMAAALGSLVSRVQHAGIEVTASATGIAASARQLERAVGSQAAASAQVSGAARRIRSTSEKLLVTVDSVASVAASAARDAAEGQRDLARVEEGMGHLGVATGSISTKLATIAERASAIGVLVTTITKVAEQTDLLSFNASIEAETGGAGGEGFAVVAREIRRLADRTAVATLEIERTVRAMQAAVAQGVAGMDAFAVEVQNASAEVEATAGILGRALENLHAVEPRFAQVRSGIEAQSEGAGRIEQATESLSGAARRIADSLREFDMIAARLSSAVDSLRNGIATVRVDA